MEESKLNEYIESMQRLGAHGGIEGELVGVVIFVQGGLGTATFGEEEIVEDEEMKKDPKYGCLSLFLLIVELYKHFVKPGYKRVIKNLTVFEDEDEKPKSVYFRLIIMYRGGGGKEGEERQEGEEA